MMETIVKKLVAIGYTREKAIELYKFYARTNSLNDLQDYIRTKESLKEVSHAISVG